jgi:hypothetical protein
VIKALETFLPPFEKEFPFVDFGKPQRRAEVITSIVQDYANNPLVANPVGSLYRYGHEDATHNLSETALDQTRLDAKAYRRLPNDSATLRNYFKYVERGLASYVAHDIDGLIQEEQALVDLTIAYHAICLTSLPVVSTYLQKHKLVNRKHAAVSEEDLLHDGYVGLLDAVQRYDYTRGVPFWDFAQNWVHSAVQTGFRTQRSGMPLTHVDEQKWLRLRGVYSDLAHENTDKISNELLAERTGLEKEEVIGLMNHSFSRKISLDQPQDVFRDRFVRDLIHDRPLAPTLPSNPNSIGHHILLAAINEAQLKPTVLAVISLRNGVYMEKLAGTTIGKHAVSYDQAFAQVGGIINPTNGEIAVACGLSLSSIESYVSLGMRALRMVARPNE